MEDKEATTEQQPNEAQATDVPVLADTDGESEQVNDMMAKEERQSLENAEAREAQILSETAQSEEEAAQEDQGAGGAEQEAFLKAAEELGSMLGKLGKEHPELTTLAVIGSTAAVGGDIEVQAAPFMRGYASDVPFLLGNLILDKLPEMIKMAAEQRTAPAGANRAQRRRAERTTAAVAAAVTYEFFVGVLDVFCENIGNDEMIRAMRRAANVTADSALSGNVRRKKQE